MPHYMYITMDISEVLRLGAFILLGLFDPEDGGYMFLRNVG
jgi:hypothetical protein